MQLASSLRKIFTAKEDTKVIDNLRSELLNLSSMSDNVFDELLLDGLECILDEININKFIDAIGAILADDYFYRQSRKGTFYLMCSLVISEVTAYKRVDEDKENGVSHHLEMLTISIFLERINRKLEGYIWINEYNGLMKEVWLYLKAKRGRFAPFMEILHVENNDSKPTVIIETDEDDVVDDDFSAETDNDIGSLVSGSMDATSDEDVLSQIYDERNDVKRSCIKEDDFNEEPDKTNKPDVGKDQEGDEPEILDVSKLLD